MIRLIGVCRGQGKAYARIVVVPKISYARIEVESVSSAGIVLPAEVIFGNGAPILVVALVDEDQTVSVKLFDETGLLMAWGAERLTPRKLSIASKANGRIMGRRLQAVRDIDRHPIANRAFISLDGISCAEPGDLPLRDVVFGRIEFTFLSRDDGGGQVHLRFFDYSGYAIGCDEDWHCLDELCVVDQRVSGPSKRTILFSACIPQGVSKLIAWAWIEGLDGSGGIAVFDEGRLGSLRADWIGKTTPASKDPAYDEWFRAQRVSSLDKELQRRSGFECEPVFSIVTPLFETAIDHFNEMVDSVLGQTYRKFELILVNASPRDRNLARAIKRWAGVDARVTVITLETNRGIALNTNVGIRAARGDYVCFLDHDDVLEPDALYEYVKAINDYPDIDLLYCDEDKLLDGRYCLPYFKPDWNPDLICGMDYVCHFLAVSSWAIGQVDLADSVHDGAQDYHLTLAVAEIARTIHHVRRVLYHWRVHARSTALDPDEKPYARQAALLCVKQHLGRMGINAVAHDSKRAPDRFEVDYDVSDKPLVSIVVPSEGDSEMLAHCLDSVTEKSTYDNYEVIVVSDGAPSFAAKSNLGVRRAQGDYLVFLDAGIEVITPTWIELLLGMCARTNTGVVGAKLLHVDGTVRHAGVAFGDAKPFLLNWRRSRSAVGYFETARLAMNVSAVAGECLMTRRGVFEEVGGFDEEFSCAYSDVDYCIRVRERNLLVALEPRAELLCRKLAKWGTGEFDELNGPHVYDLARLVGRWPKSFCNCDPYYNPNLDACAMYHKLG